METFTETQRSELEALKTHSDWDEGYRHDCLITRRSYGFLIPSVRAAKFIPWQVQFESILEAGGFELGE